MRRHAVCVELEAGAVCVELEAGAAELEAGAAELEIGAGGHRWTVIRWAVVGELRGAVLGRPYTVNRRHGGWNHA